MELSRTSNLVLGLGSIVNIVLHIIFSGNPVRRSEESRVDPSKLSMKTYFSVTLEHQENRFSNG